MTTKYLNEVRDNVFSQNGEDGVLYEIFERIGIENQWCVDVGASDGVKDSNTRWFMNSGWHGVLIEADYDKYLQLCRYTQTRDTVNVLRKVEPHFPDNLDNILSGTRVPKDFDLLSIDVDGEDQAIWASLKNYKPRVVVIEVDSSIVPSIHGRSAITSCVELAKIKGYELALHCGNCIFVLREYAETLDIDTEHWEELFDRSWL